MRDSSPDKCAVMKQLDELFIVVPERGRDLLENIYSVASGKIDLIPHGLPDVQFIAPAFHISITPYFNEAQITSGTPAYLTPLARL